MKKKFKKALTFLLAMIMLVTTLTACNENAQSDNSSQSETSSQTTNTDKPETTAETTEETTQEETPKSPLAVTFSQESGIYKDAFSLEINCEKATEIYYTLDGSNPLTSDTKIKYTQPVSVKDRSGDKNYVTAVDPTLFDAANAKLNSSRDQYLSTMKAPADSAVDKCTVVRAVAMDSDGLYTQTQTATYFIGTMSEHIEGIEESCKAAGADLAVISISINYDDLFDSKTGIYVKGDIFQKEVESYLMLHNSLKQDESRNFDANYKQRGREWERNAHIDFFESNAQTADLAFSQDCGIRIQGNYSRSDLQKGFRLYAREEYGEKNFNYPIFGENLKNDAGETMSKFKTFTLRAGGNCAFTAKYNDTYWQSLVADMDCDTQTSRPCVVYVDGEYWGLYVLQEDYSDNYFEDTHGVDNKDVVVYKGDAETYEIGYKLDVGDLPEGETDVKYYFSDLLKFFRSHKSCESEEDYNELAQLVDVQSAMDYFAVQAWINNKWDWPGKNWSLWKTLNVDESNEYADGRWRFCFYDIEFGGVSGGNEASTNTIKEDNYKPSGLLDMDTSNPAVLIFAYLMTNENFRTAYNAELSGLSDGRFSVENAQAQLDMFTNTYSPLYEQFFNRFPKSGTADDAVNGDYASYKCIKDFISRRGKFVKNMISYIDRHYA